MFESLAIAPIAAIGVWDILLDILILLAVALLLGTLAERLGQSVIVGYLIAGTLVGPNVLGWISTQGELLNIAELGIALLLFAIGLEFSPRRLLTLGKLTLGTGPLQVVLTAIAASAVALFCGLDGREALVIGLMVTMSSTACVLRMLTDRSEIDSQHGRTSLGILLVQDIAVVPMMLLVSIMTDGSAPGMIAWKLTIALGYAVLLIGAFYVLFNFVVPRILSLPTLRKNRDLPIMLAFIMATGSAWAAHAVGLSPAMGAFAAGVLLAVSPFSTQIRADTRPLTTLMVTLFFAAIGMFGDPVWLLGHWPVVVGIVLAIVVGKPLIIALLARAFGQPWRYAIAAAICLAQVGEFSLVLAMIAQGGGETAALISTTTFRAMVSATVVTLLLTPYLVAAAPGTGARCEAWLLRRRRVFWPKTKRLSQNTLGGTQRPEKQAHPNGFEMCGKTADPTPTSDDDNAKATASHEAISGKAAKSDLILIVGFGPAGQRVAEGLMDSHQEQMVAVDLNPKNIEIARRYGLDGHLGDATQQDILEVVGIDQAQAVVLTIPDHTTTRQLIHIVRDLVPNAYIIARCRYHILHWELLNAGADEVVDEEDQLGRRLAAQVRKLIGTTNPING